MTDSFSTTESTEIAALQYKKFSGISVESAGSYYLHPVQLCFRLHEKVAVIVVNMRFRGV